jgi:hypothetical protein
MDPPRKQLTQLLKRAIELGQLSSDLDYDLAVAMLLGPMMYAKFMSLGGHKTPKDLPGRVTDAFWKAHSVTKRPKEKNRK